MEAANWLRALGLEQYGATVRANAIDAELLPNLTADDLNDLGVNLVTIIVVSRKQSLRCAPKARWMAIPTLWTVHPERPIRTPHHRLGAGSGSSDLYCTNR